MDGAGDYIFLKMWGLTVTDAEAELCALYDELNRTKFNNELPAEIDIRISMQAGGVASANPFGALGPSIYFHPYRAERSRYRESMLHEMCHLCTLDYHGPKFQAKLKEVGEGEPWLAQELQDCPAWVRHDKITAEWGRQLYEVLETSPRLKWTDARREIVKRIGCKAADFRTIVWDFKEIWLRHQARRAEKGKQRRR